MASTPDHSMRDMRTSSQISRADHSIGGGRWIRMRQHDGASAPRRDVDDVLEPLRPLLLRLQVHCVAECCGLDAFSFEPAHIATAVVDLDGADLRARLDAAIGAVEAIEDRALVSSVLNDGIDRDSLWTLLRHLRDEVEPPHETQRR